MSKLTTIRKISDKEFLLVDYDPRRPDDADHQEIIGSYDRLGLFLDEDSFTMHGIGRYGLVEDKFRKTEALYKNSQYPEMADSLRLYDISSLSAEHIDFLMKSSGAAKRILSFYNLIPICGCSYDEAEVISSIPL